MGGIRNSTRALSAGMILVAIALAYWGAQPPGALPGNAPADRFSGMRALAHSRNAMTEPHPAGSAALGRVQAYIVDTLKSLGLEVEVDALSVNEGGAIGVVENVMARIAGSGGKNTFGMTTHYDSVAFGPGAADDGSGVVVMLETARALKQGPPLMNDVVFVFTGDEEHGMGGARRSLPHRWLKDLNVMLAFEARGNHGPAFLFETSPGNLPLMRELAACPGAMPQSNSLMWEVHRRTPNGTDFGSLKDAGVLGYNVAFVGGLGYYHTANDNPRTLSPESLQHQGAYALALARHYGNHAGRMEKGEDAVFFNTLGAHLVVYPASWSFPIAVLAGLLALASMFGAWRAGTITLSKTAAGAGLLVLTLALTGAICYPVLLLTYKWFYVYLTYNGAWYLWAFIAAALGLVFAACGVAAGRIDANNLLGAGLLPWLIALVGLQRILPAASYAAAWPLILGAAALSGSTLSWLRTRPNALLLFQTALALPVLLILVPGIQALYYMGPGFTIIPCAMLAIVAAAIFAPAMLALAGRRGMHASLGLIGAAAVLVVVGWATNGYAPDKPKMSSLTYGLNLDAQKALWMSSDTVPDAYTSQFFQAGCTFGPVKDVLPDRDDACLTAPAPIAPIEAPQVHAVQDLTDGERRTVTLRYVSPDKAESARLVILAPQHVHAARADGFGELRTGTGEWTLHIPVMPRSGEITLTLTVDAGQPLVVRLEEDAFRLFDVSGLGFRARPADHIPKPNTLDWWESRIRKRNSITSNHAILVKSFTL